MCRNGHTSEPEMMAGRMRCRECHRERNRRNAAAKRSRDKGLLPPVKSSLRCPYCGLFPCRCEEL